MICGKCYGSYSLFMDEDAANLVGVLLTLAEPVSVGMLAEANMLMVYC